jgi:hypothetical protein
MSHLGTPPVSAQHPPPAPAPGRDIPIWVLVVAVAIMLALVAVVAVVVVRGTTASPKPSYPAQWDSRIAPYAHIAEQKRGLTFKHPVAVRFMQPAAFEKTVSADEDKLDAGDRAEIKHFTALMRAFGLISGDVDLFAAFKDAYGGGTLAYYSFDDQRISVRGQTISPAVRPTLVHELTHALQDQYFDIGDRMQKLAKKAEKGPDTSASSVLESINEGDAERVATLYRGTLNARQRKALAASEKAQNTEADTRMKGIPKIVLTLIGAPYALGQGLVETVAADGGNPSVDKLFRHPPTHEATLLDPFRALTGENGATHVSTPKLVSGEKKFESGEFGVLTWYLMLAQRLPLRDALAAADGWGGDAYVGYEHDDTSCARIDYAGRTTADTTRMLSALQRWVARVPGTPASVARDGKNLRFQSCDPGKTVRIGKDESQDALTLVATRAGLGAVFLRAGAQTEVARCAAGKLVAAYPVSKLTDPKFGAKDPAVIARVRQLVASCR